MESNKRTDLLLQVKKETKEMKMQIKTSTTIKHGNNCMRNENFIGKLVNVFKIQERGAEKGIPFHPHNFPMKPHVSQVYIWHAL